MRRRRTIAVGLLVFLGAGCTFLLASIFILPRLIDSVPLGDKVRFEISRIIGGSFDFKRVDIFLLPAPHVVLERPKVDLPQHARASAQLLEFYPDILPLFLGKISLNKAVLKQPELVLRVSKSPPGDTRPTNSNGVNRLVPILNDVLAKWSTLTVPIAYGNIVGGKIELVDDEKIVVALHDLDAELRTAEKNLELGVTAVSNIADSVSVSLSANTKHRKGNAHLAMKNVQLGKVAEALLPESSLKIQDGASDVGVDITMDGTETTSMGFHFSLPHVRVVHAGQTADITTRGLTGNLLVEKDAVTLTVSECILDSPSMQLSGSIGLSRQEPALRVQLEGRDIDIEATREMAIAMAGTNKVVQYLFKILHAGSIPLVTVTDQGATPGELGDWDHLVVEGKVANGDIIIPGVNLEMANAKGNIMLSQGILTADNIESTVKHSSIYNGMVRLGLKNDPLPLQVETDVHADLADLPIILRHIINDEEIETELNLIQAIQGRAKGKLRLDGDTDKLKVEVAASDLQFTTGYRRIPYPLTITDGSVSYDGSRVTWEQLKGMLGKSSFASFSGVLGLEKEKKLTISSGTSDLYLPELLPWLDSNGPMKDLSQYYGGGNGILQLSTVQSSGPLKDVRKWKFNVAGEVENLVIRNFPERPGPLKIASMRFNADQQTLRYSDGQLLMLDGSWTVSGEHRQYFEGIDKDVSMQFFGRMGPQTTSWFSRIFHVPSWLKFRPLTFAPSQFDYTNLNEPTVSAVLAVQDGLQLSSDIRFGADDEVIVDKLTIQDQTSRAALSGTFRDQQFDISYDGKIYESTLDQLFLKRSESNGWLEGKAKMQLDLQHPYTLGFTGELDGQNLYVPLIGQPSLRINNLVVKGDKQTIRIEPANLSWDDLNIALSGDIQSNSPEPLWLDLDIKADSVDIEQLMDSLGRKGNAQENKSASPIYPIPLLGTLRFSTERLITEDFTFQPLHADVKLQKDTVDITLEEAELCGISMPGTITVSPHNLQFHIEPEARGQQLQVNLDCFARQKIEADGIVDLNGSLEGSGEAKDLLKTSSGHFDFNIENGHIYYDVILINVIKFLNINQVLTDRITEEQMTEKGLGFKQFQAQIALENGTLRYEDIRFDGHDMTITGIGEIDILQEQVDFTLLVAPQKSVDTVLGWVPLIGDVFQTVVTIPLSVKGTLDDVRVLPMAPSAIGHGLKEIMKKTLGSPMKLLQPEKLRKPVGGDGK